MNRKYHLIWCKKISLNFTMDPESNPGLLIIGGEPLLI